MVFILFISENVPILLLPFKQLLLPLLVCYFYYCWFLLCLPCYAYCPLDPLPLSEGSFNLFTDNAYAAAAAAVEDNSFGEDDTAKIC